MSDACINVRGDAFDAGFVEVMKQALGQELPLEPNTMTSGEHSVYWLGPDEWLVQTDSGNREKIVAQLESSLASMHAAVNDLSDGNVVIELIGTDVIDVLAQGCTLDFDGFPVGHCAQTGLGKTGVLLRRDAADRFTVIVRRSFSAYLRQWLDHAGQNRRIEFR